MKNCGVALGGSAIFIFYFLSFPIACFQIVLDVLCADFFYRDKGLVAREWGTRFDAHTVTKVIFVLRVVDLITFVAFDVLLIFRMLFEARHQHHARFIHLVGHDNADQRLFFCLYCLSFHGVFGYLTLRALISVNMRATDLLAFAPILTFFTLLPVTSKRNWRTRARSSESSFSNSFSDCLRISFIFICIRLYVAGNKTRTDGKF